MPTELAALLGKTFIERRDVKAVQNADGSYRPDRTPWTMSDIRDHLSGKVSLGHYLVSPEGKTRVIALDLDLVNHEVEVDGDLIVPRDIWRTDHELSDRLTMHLQLLATGFAVRLHKLTSLPVAVHYSGNKGLHVYALPGEGIGADVAMFMAQATMEHFGWEPSRGTNFFRDPSGTFPTVEVETFPKQASLEGKDLGNLMRLPLGINRKSGERTFFIKTSPPPTTFTEQDPETAMAGSDLPWTLG
jgi:hypothetical protein